MFVQKTLVKRFILLFLMLLPPTSISAENEKLDVNFLFMVKGSITDYLPKVFIDYSIQYVEAKSGFNWAGDVYLMKKSGKNIPIDNHTDFYLESMGVAKRDFYNVCYKYFIEKKIKKGAVIVDHFESQVVTTKGYASISYTGNVLCLVNR